MFVGSEPETYKKPIRRCASTTSQFMRVVQVISITESP